jgi:hypothetical protein
MQQNGELNRRFGAYKNLCCGKEIVIPDGKMFPDCPTHPNLTTIWKPLFNDQAFTKEPAIDLRRVPRFGVGDDVKVIGIDAQKGKLGVVVRVVVSHRDFVHRYDVRFSDGSTSRYFGFQLESVHAKSA